MKNARKWKSSLRMRALTACLIALLALPAAAAAMPQHAPALAPTGAARFPLAPVHRDVPGSAPVAAPSSIRVVRNVTVSGGDTTLPTVLAAVALGIALTGAAYVTLRLRPLPRA
jgi:hypothetical protein